jgi:hypothetical protein
MSGGYRTTAKGQRHPLDFGGKAWPAGEYVLLVERYTPPGLEGGAEMVRGDDVVLEEDEATRLGNAGAIAPVASAEAEDAKATPGTRSGNVRTDRRGEG